MISTNITWLTCLAINMFSLCHLNHVQVHNSLFLIWPWKPGTSKAPVGPWYSSKLPFTFVTQNLDWKKVSFQNVWSLPKCFLTSTPQMCLSFKFFYQGLKFFCQLFTGTDKHDSVVLMTNDRGKAREPRWLAGATISPLAPSVVSLLSEHTQMQRHPFIDTDVMCGLQIRKPMSLYDYMVTSGGWEKDTTPIHPTLLTLTISFPCTGKMAVIRWLIGPYFFFVFSSFSMLMLQSSNVSVSIFLTLCLLSLSFSLAVVSLFAPLSLKLHLRGNLLGSPKHTCSPIKSRCICLSSLFLPLE